MARLIKGALALLAGVLTIRTFVVFLGLGGASFVKVVYGERIPVDIMCAYRILVIYCLSEALVLCVIGVGLFRNVVMRVNEAVMVVGGVVLFVLSVFHIAVYIGGVTICGDTMIKFIGGFVGYSIEGLVLSGLILIIRALPIIRGAPDS